jgi:hypothetical protein
VIGILLEKRLGTPPEGVEVEVFNPHLTIRDHVNEEFVSGAYVGLTGDFETIRAWLRPHSPIWAGRNPVAAEEFDLLEVRD